MNAQDQHLSRKAYAAGLKSPVDEHMAVLDALRRREPAAARVAMRAHLTAVIEALLEATEADTLERARAQLAEQRERYAAGVA